LSILGHTGKKYRIQEFAQLVGRSTRTLRRWDNEGRFVAKRTLSNQRYYDDSDVRKVLQQQSLVEKKTRKQQKDLESQLDAMRSFCLNRGVAVDQWITGKRNGRRFNVHYPYLFVPNLWVA
jgi:predicted site-specific integrase-resolvase